MPARLLFLLLFLTSAVTQSMAQAYEPGLLVRANGDTLRGEIENSFWLDPPKFIHFRPTATADAVTLLPRHLRTVLFAGGRYFRFEALPIDHAAETRLDRLPKGYHPDVRTDSLLAEVLLEGPASLLRVVRYSATHYFVRRPGQPVLDLSGRSYLRASSMGKMVVVDANNYQAQLEQYFGDCPAASSAARAAAFTPEGLARVVLAYNESCAAERAPTASWVAQAISQKRPAFQAGVVAGGRTLKLGGYGTGERQNSPFAGVYGEVFLPNRSISVYSDLSVSLFDGKGRTLAYTSERTVVIDNKPVTVSEPVYSAFAYRAGLASGRVGLRFHFRSRRPQRLFVGFGVEGNRIFAPNVRITDGPAATPNDEDLSKPTVPFIPELGLGWRNQRVAVSLDALGVAAMRLGLTYRLSRNPDVAKATAVARP
ncbi:hypothetical protein JAO73_14780 [Hymenobacter sp. BT523]|uniref:hypothetical protein n=1 Tax=Hymenobacter sp. BT523 TaxID=2795725 RepID=UPI0018EB53AB|nr:hypothetical protein [Hymenobacter sp. BT523]MBJ6110286.1 hypothetical protein [Hymenobacter sp. BT523]